MCTTLLDFGDTEVETLVNHFRPVLETSGIHAENVMDQWTVLKSLMYQEPQFLSHPHLSWATVNRTHQHSCPDLLAVIDLVLSLPASTADCERGFSTMNMVKSDWRSSLLSDTLSDLLIIHLCSPEIKDFDPSTAVMLWHKNSVRTYSDNSAAGPAAIVSPARFTPEAGVVGDVISRDAHR